DLGRAQQAAARIAETAGSQGQVEGLENLAAVAAAEVVVLTVPFTGQATLLKQLKPAFRPGAMLIDTTVPLAASVGGRPTPTPGGWQGSAPPAAPELVPQSVALAPAVQKLLSV